MSAPGDKPGRATSCAILKPSNGPKSGGVGLVLPGAWLPMAHFGFVGNPLPPLTEDTDEDLDDEELAETPPEVVMILGWDPLDDDE